MHPTIARLLRVSQRIIPILERSSQKGFFLKEKEQKEKPNERPSQLHMFISSK